MQIYIFLYEENTETTFGYGYECIVDSTTDNALLKFKQLHPTAIYKISVLTEGLAKVGFVYKGASNE